MSGPVRWQVGPTSRRAFLGGAAATLALPWLPSLGGAARASAPDDLRLVWWYVPNGVHMPDWIPSRVGSGITLPWLLEPLRPFQDRTVVLSGLRHGPEDPHYVTPHVWCTAAWLTGALPRRGEVHNAISVDQLAGAALGGDTAFRSLTLGAEGSLGGQECDSGWSCAYKHCVAWADPVTPLNPMHDPRQVYDLLFAGQDPSASEADRRRRRAWQASVLDTVASDLSALDRRLGVDDRRRLDRYVTSVRELERRLDVIGACPTTVDPEATVVERDDHEGRTLLLGELMALALSCGLTRVATFQQANSESVRTYPALGLQGSHHPMSHHGGDPRNIAGIRAINRWEVEMLAAFLHRLAAEPSGEGTLLDRTVVMFGSDIADGDTHAPTNLPTLVVGGPLAGDRHVDVGDRPLVDLHLDLLALAGVPVHSLPLSTGPLGVLGPV